MLAGTGSSPPRAARCTHHVKRPVWSCGPTMNPGRTIAQRSAYVSLHDPLAERLERAVGSVGDVLGRLVLDRRERPVLVAGHREVGVDGDGRDEDVRLDGVRSRLGRVGGRPAGRSPRRRCRRPRCRPSRAARPPSRSPCRCSSVGKESRVRAPAMEERHVVPGVERRLRRCRGRRTACRRGRGVSHQLCEPGQESVDLVGRVVVDDPGAHGTHPLVESEPRASSRARSSCPTRRPPRGFRPGGSRPPRRSGRAR